MRESSQIQTITALILAGSRGAADPVAEMAHVPYKPLAPLQGRPMLAYVLDALGGSSCIQELYLALEPAAMSSALMEIAASFWPGKVAFTPLGSSPALSVERALETMPDPFPLLITTGDHPLLTPAMLDHFITRGGKTKADLLVGVAPAEIILAQYPGAVRTLHRFRNGHYSGCNLFLLKTPPAARAIAYWARMETYRKKPMRLLWEIGPLTLLRFLLFRPTLEGAAALLSRRIGVDIAFIEMPFAEAAIDVDKPEDYRLADTILARRAG